VRLHPTKELNHVKIFRRAHVLSIVVVILAAACNQSGTNNPSSDKSISSAEAGPPLMIRTSESPAGTDSREPELNATVDGRIILSWVEKVADKRYVLRFATRNADKWSNAATVAEGENWFVNWADFPSVVAWQMDHSQHTGS
jgi:hypothetical protein